MTTPRPLKPVAPSGMEIIFLYMCPVCERQVPLIAPTRPTMVRCDACAKNFPVMPVDAHGIQFMRLMLAEGRAALDPDFI